MSNRIKHICESQICMNILDNRKSLKSKNIFRLINKKIDKGLILIQIFYLESKLDNLLYKLKDSNNIKSYQTQCMG